MRVTVALLPPVDVILYVGQVCYYEENCKYIGGLVLSRQVASHKSWKMEESKFKWPFSRMLVFETNMLEM